MKHGFAWSCLIGTALALTSLLLAGSDLGQQLELRLYDLHLASLGSLALPPKIMLVAIDDLSFDLMAERMQGLRWPYPRSIHARVLEHLAQAGARAVFFDVLFDLPSGSGQEDDHIFAAAVRGIPTVLAAERSPKAESRPLPVFTDAGALAANAYLPIDQDGVI